MQLQYILNRLRDGDYSEYYASKPSKGNGKPAQYIPWYRLPEILDTACSGDGYWELLNDVSTTDTMVIVKTTIKISGWDGQSVARSAIGSELVEIINITGSELTEIINVVGTKGTLLKQKEIPYGDATSNASAMAFRRCLALFGVALELWEREREKPPGTISREEWLAIQQKKRESVSV